MDPGFRRYLKNSVIRYGAASLIPRSLAIGTALVLAPLTISKLGPVAYGYWVLATQVPNLVVSPDLGLGNGILNEMSQIHRTEGALTSQQARLLGLSKVLVVIAGVWSGIGILGATLYTALTGPSFNWPLASALCAGILCFTAGIPASIYRQVQLAQEKGHRSALWEGAGKFLTLICCFATLFYFPDLILLVVAYVFPTTLTLWLNAVAFRRREFGVRKVAAPNLRTAASQNRHVFAIGKYFVVLQICYVLSVAIDPYLINAVLKTGSVTYVSVTRRPYDLLPVFVSLFAAALWPVFGRLYASRDFARLRRIVWTCTGASSMGIACLGIGILIFRNPLYSVLGQHFVNPPISDLLWVTLQTVSTAALLILTNLLNAASAVRAQVTVMIISTIILVVVKVVALQYGGVHLFLAAAALGSLLATTVPIALLVRQRLGDVAIPARV